MAGRWRIRHRCETHQYVNQRRTLRELGYEVRRDVPQMSRIAKRYGIPVRPPSEACHTHN
ncbi:MAG: hypothetical protein EOO27_46345 [Comamonadaceae bacterium]|nr:MAG: hypothetical protein EOO27_46345 [Comamonadaceae bacterium]